MKIKTELLKARLHETCTKIGSQKKKEKLKLIKKVEKEISYLIFYSISVLSVTKIIKKLRSYGLSKQEIKIQRLVDNIVRILVDGSNFLEKI